jgi:AcrR family transcriptional regulator
MAMAAARAVFEVGRGVTVSDVVERARVGRNTFYAHFEDLPAALEAGEREALAKVSEAFVPSPDARTPIERLRGLVSEWLDLAASEPHLVMLVIRGDGTPRGAHVKLRETIENALRGVATSARAAGVIGRAADLARLRALTGAFIVFAERIVEENRQIDESRLKNELVDFSLRALR